LFIVGYHPLIRRPRYFSILQSSYVESPKLGKRNPVSRSELLWINSQGNIVQRYLEKHIHRNKPSFLLFVVSVDAFVYLAETNKPGSIFNIKLYFLYYFSSTAFLLVFSRIYFSAR